MILAGIRRPPVRPAARRRHGAVAAVASLAAVVTLAAACGRGSSNAPKASPHPNPTVTQTPGSPVSDDFNTPVLNTKLWSFRNPLPGAASVGANGKEAVLTLQKSSPRYFSPTLTAPALVQSVANRDLAIELKFDSEVLTPFADQGLVAIADDSDFVRIGISSDGAQAYVSASTTSGGIATNEFSLPVRNGANFYLRIKRTADLWSFNWSYDGQAWTSAASFTAPLVLHQIGPYVALDTANPQRTPGLVAKVAYFHNIAGMTSNSRPTINLWYGRHETFGRFGEPQRDVNLLGNVTDPAGITSLSYSLNGGIPTQLQIGENPYRLSSPGDFNAEIPFADLNRGDNLVVITAIDSAGASSSQTITLDNSYAGQSWPGDYAINWSSASSPDSVAQVVDGNWAIQPGGTIRTMQTGYDRLIDLGDMTSWSQYQAKVEVTINALPPSGAPFGVGPIFGWQGHTTVDSQQPADGHPFSAWFNYSNGPADGSGRLNIYANSARHHESTIGIPSSSIRLMAGVTYEFEMQATTNPDGGTSHYAFKVWPKGGREPSGWLVQADGDLNQGSLLLASYWVDVSYGPVTVSPLASPSSSQPLPVGAKIGSWTVVQSAFGGADSPGSTTATISATLPHPTAAGDEVLAVVAGSASGTAPTLIPTGPLSPIAPATGPSSASANNPFVQTFAANHVPGGLTSFPISVADGPTWGSLDSALLVELSGPAISLDSSTSAVGGGTTTAATTPSLTATTTGEIAVLAAAWDNSPGQATEPGSALEAADLNAITPLQVWFQPLGAGIPLSPSVSWGPRGRYDWSAALLALRG